MNRPEAAPAELLFPHEDGSLGQKAKSEDLIAGLDDLLGIDLGDDEEGEEAVAPEDEEGEVSEEEVADPELDEDDDTAEDEEDEESEDSESEDSDEEDDDAAEGDAEELFELPNGEKKTRQEVIDGFMRTQDYTRKSTELAQRRTAVSERETEVAEKVQELAQGMEDLEVVMAQMAGDAPDPNLRLKDPGEYAAQMEEYRSRLQTVQAIRNRRAQLVQEAQRYQERALAERRGLELERLQTKVPEFRDEGKRNAALAEMAQFFTNPSGPYGFTQEELAMVGDHRLVLMMRDAMKYHQSQKKAAEVADTKPKPGKKRRAKARGTDQTPRGKNGRFQKARAKVLAEKKSRLAETGSIRDAAAALEEFLGDDF